MPDDPSPPARQPGAARAWAIWWVLLAALWLALVDTVVAPELVAGAVAAAVAATGAVVVRANRRVVTRPRVAWLRSAWRPLVGTFRDMGPLAVALWRRGVLRRPEQGVTTEVPYAAVGSDPRSSAHRVLTQALGSLAPNTIIVCVDHDRRTMVVHQLVATGDPAAESRPLPEP
jgi:multisubunit Na+/H+ antiporter MnhE subunit